MAIDQASNDIIFFFDDDITVEPDIIRQMLQHLDEDSVAVVGGPNLTPKTDSRMRRYFGYAKASGFATSKMSNRYKEAVSPRNAYETDLILCNLVVKKSVLHKEGAFVESLWPNEENELFVRIIVSWLSDDIRTKSNCLSQPRLTVCPCHFRQAAILRAP